MNATTLGLLAASSNGKEELDWPTVTIALGFSTGLFVTATILVVVTCSSSAGTGAPRP